MDDAAFQQRVREVMDRMRSGPGGGQVLVAAARQNGRKGRDGAARAREALQRFNIIIELAMLRR